MFWWFVVGWLFFFLFLAFFPSFFYPSSLLPSFPFPLGSVFPFELFSSGFILASACISHSFRLPVYNPVFVALSFLSKELVCLAISSYVSPLHHLVSSFSLFVKLLVPVFTFLNLFPSYFSLNITGGIVMVKGEYSQVQQLKEPICKGDLAWTQATVCLVQLDSSETLIKPPFFARNN